MKRIILMCTAVCFVTASSQADTTAAAARFQNAVKAAKPGPVGKEPAIIAPSNSGTIAPNSSNNPIIADDAFGEMYDEDTGNKVKGVKYIHSDVSYDEKPASQATQPSKKQKKNKNDIMSMSDNEFEAHKKQAAQKHAERAKAKQASQQEDDMTGIGDLFQEPTATQPAVAAPPKKERRHGPDEMTDEEFDAANAKHIARAQRTAQEDDMTGVADMFQEPAQALPAEDPIAVSPTEHIQNDAPVDVQAEMDRMIREMTELRSHVKKQAEEANKLNAIKAVFGRELPTNTHNEAPKAVRD